MTDTLIIIQATSNELSKSDLAAAGFGREAAAVSGGSFDILLLGPSAAALSAAAAGLGGGTVFTMSSAELEVYTAEAFAAAAAAFLSGHPYRLAAAATSSATKEYFPRLAALLDVPMASDVLKVESVDSQKAVLTRAVFVGNLLATVELEAPQVLVTCRSSEFAAPAPGGESSAVEPVDVPTGLASPGKVFVGLEAASSDRPDLKEADIIVSVGRGTRGPDEGIPLCEKLADVLGAALGATRAVVDAGWLANEFQIGQTGKIVAPEVYVAIGLSGSIQHLAGMRNSKTIVAINKDPEAPIFEVADLGLVADLFDAVPELTEALESRGG
ncbi:MAG: electron transfer flavoprotein subunit alpha/FixB family protein [Planctomycetota bacterium]|nr:electron transfer flavoprotein subunit alpha/FixB family protein [Planctomycetota bacterium]